jgi:hypothetical protein
VLGRTFFRDDLDGLRPPPRQSVRQHSLPGQNIEIEIGIEIEKRLHEKPISIAISMPPSLAQSAGNSRPANGYG